MHLADGILPITICAAGYASTASLTWLSLRQINRLPDPQAGIPRASLLAAGFFVVSWIHIPIPPTSVHLMLNGLIGMLLGWYAFPAILIALFFQAVMFQHGGLLTLGVNATMIGAPAILAHLLFQRARQHGLIALHRQIATGSVSFLIGSLTLAISVLIFFGVQLFSIDQIDPQLQRTALITATLGYLPLILIEGVFAALVCTFLLRVQPALLGIPAPAPAALPTLPATPPAQEG